MLEGKGVLVTGGATGVGAAIVTALANAGAYVTIADNVANEGQRLMLDLISQNKHVQYLHTPLSSFRSQTESFAHAAAFSPTATLCLVVINTLPPCPSPPPPPSSPLPPTADPGLLGWLADPPFIPGFPPTLGPPPTAWLDRSVTSLLYSVHLAFHHFKAAAAAAGTGAAPRGGHGDGVGEGGAAGAERHILFLAPREHVVPNGLRPGMLASGAAAAGLRAVFGDLKGLVQGDVPGLEGAGVRVNLVATGPERGVDGISGHGGRAGESMRGGRVGKPNEVLAEENERVGYDRCVDAVMRVIFDNSLQGRAFTVTDEGLHDVAI